MFGSFKLSTEAWMGVAAASVGIILLLLARLFAYARANTKSHLLFRKQKGEMKQLDRLLWQQELELKELHDRMKSLEESSHREVVLFSEITSILGNVQDVEESLKAAFVRMLEILSIDFGILEFTGRRSMTIKVHKGCDSSLMETLDLIAERGWVLEGNLGSFSALTFEHYQKSRNLQVMASAHSLLCFPCRVKRRHLGFFVVGFHRPHHYSTIELDGLHFCAEQFAVSFQTFLQLLDTEELSQLRHDYIANVSHELKTPLTTIYGYLNILKSYPAELFQENEKQEMFSVMTDECQRLIRLINNLLLSVKVEQESFSGTMNPVAVSLEQVVTQTCRFMDRELKAKNVDLRTNIPKNLPPIEGNLDLLYQIFQNLIANSIKFSSKDPVIEVSAFEEGNHITISVGDNGVGIEAQDLPKIFEKFYRAESQAATRPGLGIGLYLVQKLVELHHGDIQVASELNKGTTFTMRFPIMAVSTLAHGTFG